MLQFSEESRRLTSTFLTYRNDIDIYTEDGDKDKEFYNVLFRRLIKNDIRINDVTPLGSRDIVQRRCSEELDNKRKKIFIIDGDINVIHGQNIPNMKNLFVLDAYCIENFLLDRSSVINFIYLSCGTKSKEAIDTELSFEDWLNAYSNKFIDLFIHFALIDFFGGPFKLFNAQKYHVKKDDQLCFDESIIEQDIDILKEEILQRASQVDFDAKYDELKTKWSTTVENLLKIVSGKDYLIPILLIKSQCFRKSKASPTLEEAKFNLVQYCDLTRLKPLKDRIESL